MDLDTLSEYLTSSWYTVHSEQTANHITTIAHVLAFARWSVPTQHSLSSQLLSQASFASGLSNVLEPQSPNTSSRLAPPRPDATPLIDTDGEDGGGGVIIDATDVENGD